MSNKIPGHIHGFLNYISKSSEKASDDLIIQYFRKLFGSNFKRESEAANSDGYVQGKLVLELKGENRKWFEGFFQGLAYSKELEFSIIVVAANNFVGVWKVKDIPQEIRNEILESTNAPAKIGVIFASKYRRKKKELLDKCLWKFPEFHFDAVFPPKGQELRIILKNVAHFEKLIKSAEKKRFPITTKNFTTIIAEMVPFFGKNQPIMAPRAFYSMIYGWSKSSKLKLSHKVPEQATLNGEIVNGILPGKRPEFKKYVENHYVSIGPEENEDDFFAKYDKAIDSVDLEFRKKHGIFFTDLDLSKFVMWFVKDKLGETIGEDYLVIDPACGSGNLVTNWKSPLELRHKVVSEIEPELLFAVEQRMKGDKWHNGKFTVVPRVSENKGLNFLDISAKDYLEILKKYLYGKGQKPDKPLAILCNPPYRGDDDQSVKSVSYTIHESITDVSGTDAQSDRYVCFLAQMKNICAAAEDSGLPGNSLLLIFSPLSWLTNRPRFSQIRKEILSEFRDIGGLIVNSKAFFDVRGKFPIAFTIWEYVGENNKLDHNRSIPLYDFTMLKKKDLASVGWGDERKVDFKCNLLIKNVKIRYLGAKIEPMCGKWVGVGRRNLYRNLTKPEKKRTDEIHGGLPKGDPRHGRKTLYGYSNGEDIGFLLDLTPCRTNFKDEERQKPWFYLDKRFMRVRTFRIFSGLPDSRSYCPRNLLMAEKLFMWFALGKVFLKFGYPMWANTLEMWPITNGLLEDKVKKVCIAIGYAENECLEVTFPANNPIEGCSEIRSINPMSPLDLNSYWSKNFKKYFNATINMPYEDKLVVAVDNIYKVWEKRFKREKEIYIDYKRSYFFESNDFKPTLTIGSGLPQIKDFAINTNDNELIQSIEKMQLCLNDTKKQFYNLLTDEDKINYFGMYSPVPRKDVIHFKPKTAFEKVLEKRLALSVYIIRKFSKDSNFGRVKFAKTFYVADVQCGLNLQTEYYREAAGPLDQRALYNKKIGIEPLANKYGYFSTVEIKRGRGKKINYLEGENIESILPKFNQIFKNRCDDINYLLDKMISMDTEQSEIFATLYACWNDSIIKNKKVSDEAIIKEFRENWHRQKGKYKKIRLQKALSWMRKNKLIPKGLGQLTKDKVETPDYDELF